MQSLLTICPRPLLNLCSSSDGVDTDNCLDFRPDPNVKIEEQWSPEGYSWYGDELIANRPSRYTPEEQLEMSDTHPVFTGVCPQCSYRFDKDNPPVVHWGGLVWRTWFASKSKSVLYQMWLDG